MVLRSIFDPGLGLPCEVQRGFHAVLVEQSRGLLTNTPDVLDRELREVAVEFPAGDRRQARGLLPFGGDLRHDLVRRQAHRKRKTQLGIQVLFDTLGDLHIGHPQRPAQAGHIGETFVYRVLFHIGRVASDNREEALGEQAVDLIVRGQDHHFRAMLFDLGESHAACHPARFGLIAHRGSDAALFAGDHRPSLELWTARLLARGKKRITINMKDGARKGMQGKRRLHS